MKIFNIEKQHTKIKINLLGIKISLKEQFFLNPFKKPVFRNDDVSVDTHLGHFKEFCETFHKYGYKQLHAISLYGYLNCNFLINNVPTTYEGYGDIAKLDYCTIKELSKNKFIGDNKELVDYINSIPDDIALHGLYHTDYSKMSYDEQYNDIKEGLKLLADLFPKKKVKIFVAPYNRTNEDTYKVCKEFNLKVSALEGKHLEAMIDTRQWGIKKGMVYRYHHHRFYPESTFFCYTLSIEKLDNFLRYNKVKKARTLPSIQLVEQAVHKYHTQEWFFRSFVNFEDRKHQYFAYKWIISHIKKNKLILESGCGIGGSLYHLHKKGYKRLFGYDYDKNAIAAANEITDKIYASIYFSIQDGNNPKYNEKFYVISGINWIYHVPDYSLEKFISLHLPYLANEGYFIFDMIDKSFNAMKNNQYLSQDWNKPINERRPSEYLLRYSEDEVREIAKKFNFDVVFAKDTKYVIPHKVYVLKRKKIPRICILCDIPNWAYDNCAQEIKKQLSKDFDFDIRYVADNPKLNPKKYDLLHVCFWGEMSHKQFNFPKNKILKEVSSHKWQDSPVYGSYSPKEMANKYLCEAEYVFCTSEKLFNLLKDARKNVMLQGNGFSPLIFRYKKERQGEMQICWAGNIKHPIKGVEDILIPSTKDKYILNIASNLTYEEMCDFYNNSDIFVITSKSEAGPLTLIEAMACGCFPVANRVGIAPELIRHKENGYLVKERTVGAYIEAFEWCKDHLDFIREQGKKNAKEIYEKRRWEIMAEGYRKMYKECLKSANK